MRLLLRCVGVLAVLWCGPAAGHFGRRFRRQDEAKPMCVTCGGTECSGDRTKTSTCDALYTPGTDGPEKALAEKLADTFGADNVASDKLIKCYTLSFKDGETPSEFRDCGPADACATLQGKAAELKIEVVGCVECDKAAAVCNNDTVAKVSTTTEEGPAPPEPGPGPGPGPEPGQPDQPDVPSDETTTASPDGDEKSGTHDIKILSNLVHLMWVTVVLLVRLE